MSEQVTVEAVKDARDWNSKDDKIKLTFYTLDICRSDGTTEEVDHGRQQGGAEPEPGEKLDVIFEDGKFRRKMKKAPNPAYAGGSEAKSSTSPSSGKSPDVQRQIIRQHSQGVAVQVMVAMGGFSRNLDEASTLSTLKNWIDWFDADVLGQGAKGEPGSDAVLGSTSATSAPSSPTASSNEPAPPSPPAADEAHHLDEALNNLGVTDADERRWLTEAWSGLHADKQTIALTRMTMGDSEAQAGALKRLRELAGQMPESYRHDDNIPF